MGSRYEGADVDVMRQKVAGDNPDFRQFTIKLNPEGAMVSIVWRDGPFVGGYLNAEGQEAKDINDQAAKAKFDSFCRDKLGLSDEQIEFLGEEVLYDVLEGDPEDRNFDLPLENPAIRGKFMEYVERLQEPARAMDVDDREPGVGGKRPGGHQL